MNHSENKYDENTQLPTVTNTNAGNVSYATDILNCVHLTSSISIAHLNMNYSFDSTTTIIKNDSKMHYLDSVVNSSKFT